MLTFRDPLSNAALPISVAAGDTACVGFVAPAGAAAFTRARVLVLGDLVRRILEDVHCAQVLAVLITDDRAAADDGWRSELMVRPVTGVFSTRAGAEADLGRPLDLMITADISAEQPTLEPPAVEVAPVHAAAPFSGVDPATVRFALARVPYEQPLDITGSVLGQAGTVLARWRDRLDRWGHHPSRPMPPDWRTCAIAALDRDLDVAAVVTMMEALEDDESIEPGAKFEMFAYLDRVLAVDLARNLGRTRS
jgi:hypothetical protein